MISYAYRSLCIYRQEEQNNIPSAEVYCTVYSAWQTDSIPLPLSKDSPRASKAILAPDNLDTDNRISILCSVHWTLIEVWYSELSIDYDRELKLIV